MVITIPIARVIATASINLEEKMREELHHMVVDRTEWESGPWDSEPDRMEWIHEGFACLASRNDVGTWCGYVGVPEQHQLFGKSMSSGDVEELAVHGGITYCAECRGHICHVPKPGMPDRVWWIGFDCGHSQDVSPGMEVHYKKAGFKYGAWMPRVYRDANYVRDEVNRLAKQLRDLMVSK